MTTTVWAVLGNAFYLALVLNGWVRADGYLDGHGLVAMVQTVADVKKRPFLDPRQP